MTDKKKFYIGLAGFGTVGSGVVNLILENAEDVYRRTGCELIIKKIAEPNAKRLEGVKLPKNVEICSDAMELIEDKDLDLLIELIGGTGIAKAFISKALENKFNIVTANKALLAEHGTELFTKADANNVSIRYEAAIAGGIPIVQTLRESLAGNKIQSILGILNGTSNFILSEMTSAGDYFDTALEKAREAGYAEADPSLDIDGHDTAHKLSLLIRLAWGVEYPYEKLLVQGVRNINKMDIDFARDFGYRIKLLGQANIVDGKIEAGVFPTLVNHTYLLARVGGAYNAVRVEGNGVGPLFLHGLGAGSLATASAVLSDIIALARDIDIAQTGFITKNEIAEIVKAEDVKSPWYLRFNVSDTKGRLRDLAGALADEDVSIAQAIQRGEFDGGVPLVFTTHIASAGAISRAVEAMKNKNLLLGDAVCYRIM